MFWNIYVKLCNKQGLTPNAVAKKLSISSGSVTAWKNGRTPQINSIKKMADFFGVSTDYLLGKENSPLSYDNELSPTQKELIALFDSAAPELQSAVLAVLKVHAVQTRVPDADEATK